MRHRHQRQFAFSAVGWLIALLLLVLSGGCALAGTTLFGAQQIYFADLRPFTKWNAVVARTARQLADPRELCPADPDDPDCVLARWHAFIASLRSLPVHERVARVNNTFNRVPYVPSTVNWHNRDHWETPFEFLQRGGQCEDFAIAKLAALSESGIDERDLRLVVVWDEIAHVAHAVAVVYLGDQALVLDNQIKDVEPDTEIARYEPFYAINRLGWWLPVAPARTVPDGPRVSP
jgi:predicted transglutaminase-like cysteine proteinase